MNGLVVTFGATQLAAGTPSSFVADLSNGQTRLIETSSPVLADVVAFIDFLTQEGEASFDVERTHESIALSLDHYFRHPQQIPGVADLIVEWTDEADVTHRWTAADAKLPAARAVSISGVSTRMNYTFGVALWVYTNTEGGELPSIPMRTGGDYQSTTPSAAGTTIISLATAARELILHVTPGAGSGSYTRKIVLDVAGLEKGCTCSARLAMPASANPTVQFFNATDTGTNLLSGFGFTSIVGAAAAATYLLEFAFDGTAWQPHSYRNEA